MFFLMLICVLKLLKLKWKELDLKFTITTKMKNAQKGKCMFYGKNLNVVDFPIIILVSENALPVIWLMLAKWLKSIIPTYM